LNSGSIVAPTVLTCCFSLACVEFEEAAELLSADPGASTVSMSASNTPTTSAGSPTAGEDVKLDLSEDEEGQEESSEVKYLCEVQDSLGVLSGQ